MKDPPVAPGAVRITRRCDVCGWHHPLGVACPRHYPSERWARHLTFRQPVDVPRGHLVYGTPSHVTPCS